MPTLESFLRRRLAEPPPGPAVQRLFAPDPPPAGWAPDLRPAGARSAAALLLVYPGPGGPAVPLTLRRDDLRHHPGQVSLPGGRANPGEDLASAALREAREEIGIDPAAIRLAGTLSTVWIAVSNFVVYPFVGIADQRPRFHPDPREVSSLIELPIAPLRQVIGLLRHGVPDISRPAGHPSFEVDGHRVWGATAIILGEFASLLEDWEDWDEAAG